MPHYMHHNKILLINPITFPILLKRGVENTNGNIANTLRIRRGRRDWSGD